MTAHDWQLRFDDRSASSEGEWRCSNCGEMGCGAIGVTETCEAYALEWHRRSVIRLLKRIDSPYSPKQRDWYMAWTREALGILGWPLARDTAKMLPLPPTEDRERIVEQLRAMLLRGKIMVQAGYEYPTTFEVQLEGIEDELVPNFWRQLDSLDAIRAPFVPEPIPLQDETYLILLSWVAIQDGTFLEGFKASIEQLLQSKPGHDLKPEVEVNLDMWNGTGLALGIPVHAVDGSVTSIPWLPGLSTAANEYETYGWVNLFHQRAFTRNAVYQVLVDPMDRFVEYVHKFTLATYDLRMASAKLIDGWPPYGPGVISEYEHDSAPGVARIVFTLVPKTSQV